MAALAVCVLSLLSLWLLSLWLLSFVSDGGVACGGPASLSPSELRSDLEKAWDRLREPVMSTGERVLIFNALPSMSALLSGAIVAWAGRWLSTVVGALAVSVMLVVALDWVFQALELYRMLNCAGWDGQLPWLLWHFLPVFGNSSAAILLVVGVVARWRPARSAESGLEQTVHRS
ncbi:hypothetical protein [Nonomuraea rubra]|uniref:hypothetical protein n=1 Tax=Nonomuraea rubra TaxID=46180 RepID=UPI0033E91CC5